LSTRFYLRNEASDQTGRPTGSATTDADAGHVGAQRLVCLTMSSAKGAAQVERTWNSGVSGPAHYDLVGLFLSPALAGQTLGLGQRFTVAAALKGFAAPGGPGQYYLRAFAYLWRPGTGWVATLSAADSGVRSGVNGGPDFGLDETWRILQFPQLGADVPARDRDRIALELWCRFAIPGVSELGYAEFWGGTDDTKADGEVVADAASYLDYSSDLLLGGDKQMSTEEILVGARDLEIDDVNVGLLDDETSVTVTYTPQHLEHTAAQRFGIQRVDKISERVQVHAVLLLPTLENLRIAWGQPSTALSVSGTLSKLDVGGWGAVGGGGEQAPVKLVLKGKAPGTDRSRTITIHKAVAVEASEHFYDRQKRTVVPVTFTVIEDSTKGHGYKYLSIEDDAGAYSFA